MTESPTPLDAAQSSATDPLPTSTVGLSQLEHETPGGLTATAGGHDPYVALRLPAYRRYAIGSTLMLLGQQMQTAAVGWDVAVRADPTGHHPGAAALGLSWVGLVGAAPVVALALPAGQLADRIDRKRLVVGTLVMSGLCSVALAAVSYNGGSLAWIYAILLVAATVWAVGGPARSAVLAQVVPMEIFSNAATWSSSFLQVAAVGGPAIAGVMIWLGSHYHFAAIPIVYLADTACAVAFALLLAAVPLRAVVRRGEPATLATLLAGIRFVWVNQIILATITLDLFAVLLGGAVYLLPVYARTVLGAGELGFGLMRAAPAVGAFSMALLLAHLPPMKRAGRDLLLAVAGFGVATIIFGVSRSLPLSLAMLFLTGAFDNISVVVRSTLVQVLTPDDMRGRVSAVNNVFIGSSNELGGFESGVTARVFGPFWSVVGGGIGTLLVVAATAVVWPAVRRFGALRDARPIESAEPVGFPVVSPPEAG